MLSTQRNYDSGLPAPFEADSVKCAACSCPVGTIEDVILWDTGMCLRMPEDCVEACRVGEEIYRVKIF